MAATIIVAVLSLVDIAAIRRVWVYSKRDFSAMMATIAVTLLFGVEPGVISGVLLSIICICITPAARILRWSVWCLEPNIFAISIVIRF